MISKKSLKVANLQFKCVGSLEVFQKSEDETLIAIGGVNSITVVKFSDGEVLNEIHIGHDGFLTKILVDNPKMKYLITEDNNELVILHYVSDFQVDRIRCHNKVGKKKGCLCLVNSKTLAFIERDQDFFVLFCLKERETIQRVKPLRGKFREIPQEAIDVVLRRNKKTIESICSDPQTQPGIIIGLTTDGTVFVCAPYILEGNTELFSMGSRRAEYVQFNHFLRPYDEYSFCCFTNSRFRPLYDVDRYGMHFFKYTTTDEIKNLTQTRFSPDHDIDLSQVVSSSTSSSTSSSPLIDCYNYVIMDPLNFRFLYMYDTLILGYDNLMDTGEIGECQKGVVFAYSEEKKNWIGLFCFQGGTHPKITVKNKGEDLYIAYSPISIQEEEEEEERNDPVRVIHLVNRELSGWDEKVDMIDRIVFMKEMASCDTNNVELFCVEVDGICVEFFKSFFLK